MVVATADESSPAPVGKGGSDHGSCPGGDGDGEGYRKQLWVFGDSYADTGNLGNLGRELTHAWYYPYGITFPRHPTGRFSDGRVLTDFVGTPTPPPSLSIYLHAMLINYSYCHTYCTCHATLYRSVHSLGHAYYSAISHISYLRPKLN